ncbi:DedA family protein [Rhizobium sullae]|uniref:DedA family protein n=1 Tax=Rhizobium sullae TaxID=50338 RepID=A0ABY5XLP7_RHISU|nr:DedA family protein [Rhizobium sullae]UWU15495.1 DedA family protein [Rhizobium sullae]
MEQFVERVGDFIHNHQAYAGLVATLIAFGESLILIGFAIPATALMLILGALVGAGTVEAGPVVAGAIIGAILGDAVSYGIGRWIGPGAANKWPLNRYRSGLARTRLFFRKYGFASVFFGRFLGPIRSTIPLVAGMMGMDHRRFQLANVSSAVVWSIAMLLPGWLAGRSASELDAAGYLERGIAALAISLAAVFASGRIIKKISPAVSKRRGRAIGSHHECCGGRRGTCAGHS